MTVISRSVQAVNYKHRSGASKLDFAGTDLMPAANGQAKVESKKGYTEIEVEFGNLQKPTTFGNEYLTYILWAISPEGRAVNLGEVLVGDNHRSKLDVTTDLQAFALIVTAEPYYAVRQPSNVVVLENVVREDTKGTTRSSQREVRTDGAGRLHSHRLQVRSGGSECEVAAGILRSAQCPAHRAIRGSRAVRHRQLSARRQADGPGGWLCHGKEYSTRSH